MNLFEASARYFTSDGITKAQNYYEKYDEVFRHRGFVPGSMLEIGVYQGISTKVFATTYPDLRIVAVDLVQQPIDFSDFPNVTYLQVDQGDQGALRQLCETHFRRGLDLVLEDASHIGYLSKLTFEAVFPYLRRGGFYIIEDWDTGYWDDWSDGSRYQSFPTVAHPDGPPPKRLPSHDFGMVGFVKSLLDITSDIRPTIMAPYIRNRWLRNLWLCQGIAIAEKD